jgi:16S rRNA (uracil1498-N3)-methyltransferase
MAKSDIEDKPVDAKIRLHVDGDLKARASLALGPDQAHYLQHVMRCRVGEAILLFNGRDGEWQGSVSSFGKGRCAVEVEKQLAAQGPEPDIWYLFAPIKRARLDYMMEKASELGAAKIIPVLTRRTMVARVNIERLQANATEAAEQCGRLSVPKVEPEVPLARLLDGWDKGRKLIFCDEGGGVEAMAKALSAYAGKPSVPWALLIGPEGGFDDQERALLRSRDFVIPVSLGPRILRADTAAMAALTVWQMILGDWA